MKRSEYDASYLPGLFQNNVLESDGVFPLEEDVICTYLDLDSLIDGCGLSDAELETVQYLMQGYSISDIADYRGQAKQTTDTLFSRAVEKVVAENNRRWMECYSEKPISRM